MLTLLAGEINGADTAWILVCTALVLLMTPGLAFFYAGMVRSKNVLGMLMQNYIAIAVVSVTWLLVGYTLAFGKDIGGVMGDFSMLGLNGAADAVPGLDQIGRAHV